MDAQRRRQAKRRQEVRKFVEQKSRTVSRQPWQTPFTERHADARTLADANKACRMNFLRLITQLNKRFEGRPLEVLYEGAGFSSFPEELEKQCERQGIKVKVFRTDLYRKKKYVDLARIENQRKNDGSQPGHDDRPPIRTTRYVRASPEQVACRFGRKFHLVVSVMGGLTYTPFEKEKAWNGLAQAVRPGGEIVAITQDNPSRKGTAAPLHDKKGPNNTGRSMMDQGWHVKEEMTHIYARDGKQVKGRLVWTRARNGIPFEDQEDVWHRPQWT